jgi:hypothetical protein
VKNKKDTTNHYLKDIMPDANFGAWRNSIHQWCHVSAFQESCERYLEIGTRRAGRHEKTNRASAKNSQKELKIASEHT